MVSILLLGFAALSTNLRTCTAYGKLYSADWANFLLMPNHLKLPYYRFFLFDNNHLVVGLRYAQSQRQPTK